MKKGFKSYEDFDPKVGDVCIHGDDTLDKNPGWRPYGTSMVLGFEQTKYEPLVWLGRVHCHVDQIMSGARQAQLAMQVETYSCTLSSFKKHYLAYTRGSSGEVDNRNRHEGLGYPSWWHARDGQRWA